MFYFKQFTIEDNYSTMKVGTDAVLLGAIAQINNTPTPKILEIGTGCGIIALMMAQRYNKAHIDTIDIDKSSIIQAQENFNHSPWADRLTSVHTSLQEYHSKTYDLIISNPPYFENSLKAPDAQRNLARHTDTLPIEALIYNCNRLLNATGSIWIILPCEAATKAINEGLKYELFCQQLIHVHNRQNSLAKRTIIELSHTPSNLKKAQHRYIRNEDNSYTEWYRGLTDAFYTHLK